MLTGFIKKAHWLQYREAHLYRHIHNMDLSNDANHAKAIKRLQRLQLIVAEQRLLALGIVNKKQTYMMHEYGDKARCQS